VTLRVAEGVPLRSIGLHPIGIGVGSTLRWPTRQSEVISPLGVGIGN
jgi:hypothetical protein